MKPNSKRGVALAYVIVITAVLLILAAALISVAKFNLDSSKNSLESRQAYLDAKSAIEYGREYLSVNPDAASADFAVVRAGGASGFAISADATNAVAVYSSTDKAINAAAKYKSSDRVRRLGYQFDTGPGEGGTTDSTSEFVACGENYGEKYVFNNWWSPTLYQQVESPYPVMFTRFLHVLNGEHYLTAPQILLFGVDAGYSLNCDNGSRAQFTSDVIYIQKNIQGIKANQGDVNGNPRLILKKPSSGRGVIIFASDCNISGPYSIRVSKGCYEFKDGVDLFQLNDNQTSSNYKYTQLTLLDEVPDYVKMNQNVIDSPDNVFPGDTDQRGANWSYHGYFGSSNHPRYIIYKKDIDGGKIWTNGGDPIIENYANLPDYNGLIINWYLNDVGNWANVLWGNDSQLSNDYYLNVSNVYLAKELNLRYVNGNEDHAKADFTVPENKTVVFKADRITLSTEYSDAAVGTGTNRPKITHGGVAARFILEAQNATDTVELHVPNAILVQYKNTDGITKSYTLQPGYYNVKQLNLFSDDAKDYFAAHPPEDAPDGGTGGSGGGTGGGSLTGGVYTNGQ